jgi:hypothetical protein
MPKPIKVHFIGEEKDLLKSFGAVESKADGMGSHLKKAAGVIAGGLAAAGAAAVAFGVSSVKAFAESEQVAAQTAAVIRSTGGAAKVTADEVGALALKVQQYSGISDEAVQSGANMLLTFKNIKNEAGAGNAIFDQSVKILADMSTAMGTDMSSSAIQLGKALNDPIAGISALSRVGITFDEGQKKQIETMVEAGNVMGAQKIILAELESQFGGSAKAAGETFAGQLNILKESLGGVQESIGQVLIESVLPAFLKGLGVGTGNSQDLAGALDELGPKITENAEKFAAIAEDIGAFVAGVKDVVTWVGKAIDILDRFIGKESVANKVVGWVTGSTPARLGAKAASGGSKPMAKNFHGIPGRAAGGPVTSGQPYMVGERGPELFVPNGSGHIQPNRGGGQPVYLNVITMDQIETQMVNRLQRRGLRGA